MKSIKKKTRKVLSAHIAYWLGIIIFGAILGVSLQFVKAWTEPTAAPPGGNVGAPINTSANAQTKSGNLNVSGGYIQAYNSSTGNYGLLNYSGYGGYFNGSGGVYSSNPYTYTYLDYPGSGWGVYTGGWIYAGGDVQAGGNIYASGYVHTASGIEFPNGTVQTTAATSNGIHEFGYVPANGAGYGTVTLPSAMNSLVSVELTPDSYTSAPDCFVSGKTNSSFDWQCWSIGNSYHANTGIYWTADGY